MSAALLDAYAAAWATGRADAIADFWDSAGFRFYKAEEVSSFFNSWTDTVAYWQANEAMHETLRLSFSDVVPVPLDGRFSMLIARMRWDIRFTSGAPAAVAGRAMGGDNHVMALVADDRFVGWCEAPDAAITYIRRLYEDSARL